MRNTLSNKGILVGALVIILGFFTLQSLKRAEAGIPVIDVAGLVQSAVTAVETVTQTIQQIEEYRTQLTQFENQLENTINPEKWEWGQIGSTIKKLRGASDTIKRFKTTYKSLDKYLDSFKDIKSYKEIPCFTQGGCSSDVLNQLAALKEGISQSQKQANDAVFKGLEIQQKSMTEDVRQLELLQRQATTVEGQVQAIQLANQLSSSQINQLMQIRSLLMTQQAAATSMLQATVDKNAREDASKQKLYRRNYKPSPLKTW